MKINNSRGSALWESLPLLSLIIFIVMGVLLVGYLLFARAFVNYQGEQALYCLTEGRPRRDCHARLTRQVKKYLPWGSLEIRAFEGNSHGARIRVRWGVNDIFININRELPVSSR